LRLFETVTGQGQEIITSADRSVLNRPHASPDDRWLAFRNESNNEGKTFVAPLRPALRRRETPGRRLTSRR
jgi:hypothetical protein